jgi:ABC-type multidrug transport system fused ATPase/permease subunit
VNRRRAQRWQSGEFAALLVELGHYAGLGGVLAMALVAAGALLEGAGLLLLVPLVSLLLDRHAVSAAGFIGHFMRGLPGRDPGERLVLLLALFASLMIVRAGVLIARDTWLARLQHGFVESERLRLIERLAGASWQRVAQLRRARVVQVLGPEMQQVGVAAHSLLHGTVAAMMLMVHATVALVLAPAAAIVSIALLMPVALLGWGLLPRVRRFGAAVIADHERMTDRTIRLLDGLKVATAHNSRPGIVAEHRRISNAALANRRAYFRMQAASRHAATTLIALAGAAAILVGALVLRLDAAVLIVLVLILSRMAAPALLAQQSAQQIAHCLPAFAAARALDAECGLRPRSRATPPARPGRGPSLRFERVTFLHPSADAMRARGVRQVSVTIPAGALIGIGGRSGAGKTSFVDLAAGLLTPAEGTIDVDGTRLNEEGHAAHRDGVGYAGREPVLFGDTIRRNLLWGTSGRSGDALWKALERADAIALVRARGGLDAPLAERGAALSAGEAQRLALARLLLRDAPLLILDEATASLDPESERRILDAFRASRRSPTILLVSHRAETLRLCDIVLRFDGGALTHAAEPLAPARASTA